MPGSWVGAGDDVEGERTPLDVFLARPSPAHSTRRLPFSTQGTAVARSFRCVSREGQGGETRRCVKAAFQEDERSFVPYTNTHTRLLNFDLNGGHFRNSLSDSRVYLCVKNIEFLQEFSFSRPARSRRVNRSFNTAHISDLDLWHSICSPHPRNIRPSHTDTCLSSLNTSSGSASPHKPRKRSPQSACPAACVPPPPPPQATVVSRPQGSGAGGMGERVGEGARGQSVWWVENREEGRGGGGGGGGGRRGECVGEGDFGGGGAIM